jgi:Type IV secretion system pilin
LGSIVDILNRVRDMLMLVIGSLSLVMLTVGGIRYVTAGGDKDGVNGAKQTVKHALLGLGVAILAPVLIQIIKTILGQ